MDWWGPSRHDLRASGERLTEEIDVVGVRRGRVSIVGECKWSGKPVSMSLLAEIEEYKLPALLQQSGVRARQSGPRIILFSRSGFTAGLKSRALERDDLRLVEVDELVPD